MKKTATLFALASLFIINTSCVKDNTATPSPKPTHGTTPPTKIDKELLIQLVNDARTSGHQCGTTYYPPVAPVQWNKELEAAAQSHSDYMNKTGTFSHTGRGGTSAGERIREQGYEWSAYGENIAAGHPNEEAVIHGWLESQGHCKNIMNGKLTEMGVAISGAYWTQVFAAPLK